MNVPFFRVELNDDEIDEVVATLRSGWLTTGPKVAEFEARFAESVGAAHAIALNSCTAALHLALDALGLRTGDAVLVPTHTFAATAEVVRYLGAHPVLVDCDPIRMNMDLGDAAAKIAALRAGDLPVPSDAPLRAMIPVHYGGCMLDMHEVRAFAEQHDLVVIEDAAHAFPAGYARDGAWHRCGEGTSRVACFSFYANKTITTGEGGMAVTDDPELAARIRMMSLHGLSKDAWKRYSGGRSWDYRIVEAGYKYNLTDIAAAIGMHQLRRAEPLRETRQSLAMRYVDRLADLQEWVELPPVPEDRLLSWHLFPIRLRLEALRIDRNQLFDQLRDGGVACSVHYRPLHLHPLYEQAGWRPEHLPVASTLFPRLLSLPLFAGMLANEQDHVIERLGEALRA